MLAISGVAAELGAWVAIGVGVASLVAVLGRLALAISRGVGVIEHISPHFDPNAPGDTLPAQVRHIADEVTRMADAVSELAAEHGSRISDIENRATASEVRVDQHERRITRLETKA